MSATVELRGNFDGVMADGTVSGWCWSPDEPGLRRQVRVELNGSEVLTIAADQHRRDLADAKVGDGYHAFWGVIPEAARLAQAGTSIVGLRDCATGQQIGQDCTILWPAPSETPSAPELQGALDRVTRDGLVSGWCWYPGAPTHRVELSVLVDGEVVGTTLAASFRPDLRDAGVGDGAHAFSFALPWSVLSEKGLLTVSVEEAATGRGLGGAVTLRLGRMAATEERIEDLERQVSMLRAEIEARTEREIRPGGDAATRELFRTVGAFFQRLAGDASHGREPGPEAGLAAMTQALLERHDTLTLAAPHAPDATILIEGNDSFDVLYACVARLHAAGLDRVAEIVVVDAGGDAVLLPLVLRNLRVVETRAGLLAGRNEAARVARGRWLVFLAPELSLPPDWFDVIRDSFAAEPDAAVIGSRVLRADGTILQAGLAAAGGWRALGRGEPAEHPGHAHLRPVDAVPDLAWAMLRSEFERMGGFSGAFRGGLHATVDLCIRLRAAGRVVLSQNAATARWLGPTGPSSRFVPDLALPDGDPALLRDRLAGAQLRDVAQLGAALVIDTELPRPDRDAGSVATFEQMRLLRRLGWHVTFAAADGVERPAEAAMLERHGIEVARAPGPASATEWLQGHGAGLRLVQVYRHANASLFLERLRLLAPEARVVFSPADLHYLREEREAALAGRTAGPALSKTRVAELACVAAADATILPSDYEMALLASELPMARLVLLRWIARTEPPEEGFAGRDGACFVGNFNHAPNGDAVIWFVREVLPRVRDVLPDFRFHVAGSNLGGALEALASDAVVIHGWLPELRPFFATMRASLAPLRYGAGFKGKIGTSLSHGLPTVATSVALEGSGLAAGDGVLVADDAAAFADAVVRLHEDAGLWAELSARGLARCEALYSPDAALATYRALLRGLGLPTA